MLAAGCGTSTGGQPGAAFTPDAAVQPQLAANFSNPSSLVAVWEQDRWNAIGARAIEAAVSADGGRTWRLSQPPAFSACTAPSGPGAGFDRASDPSITVGMGGVVVASALAFSAGNYLAVAGTSAVLVTRSLDGGATWQAAQAVQNDAGAGSGPYFFNDRDTIAADPNSANVYLVWDRINSNSASLSSPSWFTRSTDSGATWSAPVTIYDPGPGNQTFNNQLLVLPNGGLVDVFTVPAGFTGNLYAIRSGDRGSSWSSPTLVAPMNPIGTTDPIGASAPPVRDSVLMAQTAVDPVAGTIAAVWQESSFSNNLRDGIALSLSSDGGLTWSPPRQVNAVAAVAAFDPGVHFGAGGRIAVTYYDFRDYVSGSQVLSTGLWLRESSDGGQTWTETRLYGPFDLTKAPPADQISGNIGNALFLGDQQGLAWNGTDWAAVFAATNSQGARIFAATTP